ncbi:aspartic proteinase CDR1-like [Papaver somniferum]|uniref:aspartic proteinase CDR1-like n=1 Tax=Papaver somniferum TaxID=3469 RepID=UPI000E6F66CF|nr:aspartic proteinase CDR1-like [Papaver somniferum]
MAFFLVTSGVVAEEKFTVGSNDGGIESIKLHFGCGLKQRNFEKFIGNNHLNGKPDLIVGILGLGRGQRYFLNQLGVVGEDTYLRFGADATIGDVGQIVHTTPLVVPQSETSLYYLTLEDISVGNKRVGFTRGTFKLNSQGGGGIAIDSGTPIFGMYKDHFDRVADLVKEHFKKNWN